MTKEQALLDIDASGIKSGQLWRHYKGNCYRVLAVALDEATLTPMVIYQSAIYQVFASVETPWVRTLANFLSAVEGTVEHRFYPVFDKHE